MRRAALVLVAALAVGAGAVTWFLGGVAPIATGYAAQIGCGAHLISGRTIEAAASDLPDNPLVPFLRLTADADTVEARLLGAWRSVSVHTAAGGCQLVDPDDPQALRDALADADDGPPAPVVLGDDLVVPTAIDIAAANAGFDTDVLDAAITGAFAEDADPATEVGTRAVVVVHQGTVVAERYADGFDADTPLLGWSMTKSVANTLAGRLVHDGLLDLDDDHLMPAVWADDDPRSAITLAQLLTMTDGLAFEEVYDPDTDASRMLFRPRDTAVFAAEMPLEHDPGTSWSYSSGSTNIVCDVLARVATASGDRVAGTDRRRVLDEVFGPLGMRSAVVGTDASGDPVCSSYGYATARDWARFGLWLQQDGVWAGERLLPEGWVEWSTTPVELPTEEPYGAGFWLNAGPLGVDGAPSVVRMPGAPVDAYWASGHEGQHVVVLPSHDLVVVRLGLTRGHEGVEWGLEPLLAGVVEALGGAG